MKKQWLAVFLAMTLMETVMPVYAAGETADSSDNGNPGAPVVEETGVPKEQSSVPEEKTSDQKTMAEHNETNDMPVEDKTDSVSGSKENLKYNSNLQSQNVQSSDNTISAQTAASVEASINISQTDVVLINGENYCLSAVVTPAAGTQNSDYTVVWSSSDPKVASVDEAGNVKANTIGKTEIQAQLAKKINGSGTVETTGLPSAACSISVIDVSYSSHVQNIGWMPAVQGGTISGTTGQSLQMEALKIKIESPENVDLGISCQAHVQNIGWMTPVRDNMIAGTTGRKLHMEAVRISLTGTAKNQFDIYYKTRFAECW